MSIKYLSLFLIGYFVLITAYTQQRQVNKVQASDPVITTDRFEFYNNFWINLHHFLYQKAARGKDTEWDSVFSKDVLNKMSSAEKERLGKAIVLYKDQVIDKDLLFNGELFSLKRALIEFEEGDEVKIEEADQGVIRTLNDMSPIYKKYYWDQHTQSNLKVIEERLAIIEKYENAAFKRIEKLSRRAWRKEKVRIDLSYYSNWAGAYTTVDPITHAVLSSQIEGPEGDWLELLYHEPTHEIISSRRYAVAETINRVAGELNVDAPRGLWHAILFYITGVVTQEFLEKEGVEYELYMFRKDVFSAYHEVLKAHGPGYMNGEIDLEEYVTRLIKDLARD